MSIRENLLILFFAFILGHAYFPKFEMEPRLINYYNEFMGITNYYCPNLRFPIKFSLKFNNLVDPVIGTCYRKFNSRDVVIDDYYYNHTSDKNQRALIFHELTHCILNLNHVNDHSNYMDAFLNEDIPYDTITNQLVDNLITVCGGRNDRP